MTTPSEQEIRDWLAADKYTGLPGTGTVKDVCRELQTQRDECRRERDDLITICRQLTNAEYGSNAWVESWDSLLAALKLKIKKEEK